MPIDVTQPGTPGWWVQRLFGKLTGRQPRLARLWSYMDGDPPLLVTDPNIRHAYRVFQRMTRTNFAELVVAAVADRMQPAGVSCTTRRDQQLAAETWRANAMGVEVADVLEEFLALGDGYMIVGPPDTDTGLPVTTGEDPRQVVTVHDPVRQRRVRAALKVFHDDDEGRDLAFLWLPDGMWVATRERRSRPGASPVVRFSPSSWDWDPDRGGEAGQVLRTVTGAPLGRVPVVRFRNRRGVGEFERHTDVLDRINFMILQRVSIAVAQAFRQRALLVDQADMPDTEVGDDGVEREIDYSDMLAADPGSLWKLPRNVELWESAQADLSGVLAACRDDLKHLGAVTRTPMHMLDPSTENQSAEGAALAREGLVFRAEDRIARAAMALEDVTSLQLAYLDRPKARPSVVWTPPERYSLSERGDAASKASDLSLRARLTDIWQVPPDRVDEVMAQRAEEHTPTASDSRRLSVAEAVQKVYLGVGTVITADEARAIVNAAGADLVVPAPSGLQPTGAPAT